MSHEGVSKYGQLGVDAGKKDVRDVFEKRIENEYPNAFVNIITDPINKEYGFTQHMDGDGSKFVQRLLIYSETGNSKVIRGAVDDALQMNLGDIAASGFVFGPIMVTDVININAKNVPKKMIMEEIGQRFEELLEIHRKYGFDIHFLGGETADLPTQVNSATFDVGVSARALKTDIIRGEIEPGDKIYGFASDGQAVWEDEYNSGMMSNGVTLTRVGTMSKDYQEKYPHLGIHQGKYKVGEKADLPHEMSVSDAIISPTRQWSILIRLLAERLKEAGLYDDLHGMSLDTGGAVSKINQVGKGRGILYIKHMPTPPPLFRFIQQETGESWKEMYRGLNCGVGIDVVGKDNPKFEQVLQEVSEQTQIKLYELGKCEAVADSVNKVVAKTDYGVFDY